MPKTYNSIDDYYHDAESHDGKFPFETNLCKRLSVLSSKTEDPEIKSKIEWERMVMSFNIRSGKVEPFWSTPLKDGTTHVYPDYKTLDESAFQYLKERAEKVQNHHLIIKYNHVLWSSPKPHNDYAIRAMKSYLDRFYFLKDKEEVQTHFKVGLLENMIVLSFESNQYLEESKNLFNSVLFDQSFWKFGWQISLINFMLNQKWFVQSDYSNIPELIDNLNSIAKEKVDYFELERNLETALQVSKRLNTSKKEILREFGNCCEAIAEEQINQEPFIVPMVYFSKALKYFDVVKDQEAGERVSHKLAKIKEKVELAKISVESEDVTHMVNLYQEFIDHVLSKSPDSIYLFLTENSPYIFPIAEKLKKVVENLPIQLRDFFSTSFFDINSNITEAEDDVEDKKVRELRQRYLNQMHFVSILFLLPLFEQGFQRNVLNFETLYKYLLSRTWLGQDLQQNRHGDRFTFKWIELTAPGLHEFFKQIKLQLLTGKSNSVLAIDSLAPKFEGMLRDFAEVIGVKTKRSNNRSKNVQIQQVYMEDILSEPKMMDRFDENDQMFFKYLFTRQGLNIRNNVAHSYYKPKDYSITTALLIVLALLRISKYRFVAEEAE
jgi:hypothetical protein